MSLAAAPRHPLAEVEVSRYGVIAGEALRDDIFRIDSMVEKPNPEDAPSNLAIIGRYILTSRPSTRRSESKPSAPISSPCST